MFQSFGAVVDIIGLPVSKRIVSSIVMRRFPKLERVIRRGIFVKLDSQPRRVGQDHPAGFNAGLHGKKIFRAFSNCRVVLLIGKVINGSAEMSRSSRRYRRPSRP